MECINDKNILYKAMISNELCDDIKEYFDAKESSLKFVGNNLFPQRKRLLELEDSLRERIVKEINITVGQYFTKFTAIEDSPRIYFSTYGTVKPHVDDSKYGNDTHTCLIYLTDNFKGGNITCKNVRDNEHIDVYGDATKKHVTTTCEPRKTYGILFPKKCIHYTDELYEGEKIIMLIDCIIE